MNIYENKNTQSFYNLAWLALILSMAGMAIGIFYLQVDLAMKGFISMSFLFAVTSCFMVAKVVRDKHEGEKIVNKVEHAKTEKYLAERDPIL